MERKGGDIMFHPCKITVVQRIVNQQLCDEYLKSPKKLVMCNKVMDNQEFMISSPLEMPEGMCPSAWADIRPYIIAIASGGGFEFMKEKYSVLATCTDVFRPVVFKVERMVI